MSICGTVYQSISDCRAGACRRAAACRQAAALQNFRGGRNWSGCVGGFTLLELLAVITIITILAALVIGVGRHATETGRTARAKAELAALSTALENYQRNFGDYPRTDDSSQLLQALIGRRRPDEAIIAARILIETTRFRTADARDPFTDSSAVVIDPWDRPYRYAYKVPAAGWTNSSYVLYSAGPDGQDSAALLPGGFPNMTAAGNADNLHANR